MSWDAARTQAHRARLHAGRERRISRFADLLAEGYSASAAARSLGVSQQAGSQMLRDIRERLGWQAI